MTVVAPRIGIEQRRARLGIRHHLAARSRGLGPSDLAADLVVLHATDAASVYLSVAARATDLTAVDVGSALYDDRTLIRMLGMRRTMFVVPTPSAAVVQHSSSAAVATRLRRALVKELGTVVDDADPWLADVEDAVVARLRDLGGATGVALSRADSRLQTKITVAEGKAYGGASSAVGRVVAGPAVSTSGHRSRNGCPTDFPASMRLRQGRSWSGCGWPGSVRGRWRTSSGGPVGTSATPGERWRPSTR